MQDDPHTEPVSAKLLLLAKNTTPPPGPGSPHAYASPESHTTHVSLLPRSGGSAGDDAGAGSALAGADDAADDADGELDPTTSS
ncbi:MAG: hypothetical protein F2697_08860 [Actinobacteria bacterium]|nr:hypothetical protein [Actinomycetota bacterium]